MRNNPKEKGRIGSDANNEANKASKKSVKRTAQQPPIFSSIMPGILSMTNWMDFISYSGEETDSISNDIPQSQENESSKSLNKQESLIQEMERKIMPGILGMHEWRKFSVNAEKLSQNGKLSVQNNNNAADKEDEYSGESTRKSEKLANENFLKKNIMPGIALMTDCKELFE